MYLCRTLGRNERDPNHREKAISPMRFDADIRFDARAAVRREGPGIRT